MGSRSPKQQKKFEARFNVDKSPAFASSLLYPAKIAKITTPILKICMSLQIL